MTREEQHKQAANYHAQGMRRVATAPPPSGQKFATGTRVRIADDLGVSMSHFPKGRLATIEHTYAHAYGGDNVQSYSLNVDGIGSVAWYYEHQLSSVGSAA